MIATRYEIACLAAGHYLRSVLLTREQQPLLVGVSALRCAHCGSSMLATAEESVSVEGQPVKPVVPPVGDGRHCIDCGKAIGPRARRCRRCYMRHRYTTLPQVKARQLMLQARWRARQLGRLEDIALRLRAGHDPVGENAIDAAVAELEAEHG